MSAREVAGSAGAGGAGSAGAGVLGLLGQSSLAGPAQVGRLCASLVPARCALVKDVFLPRLPFDFCVWHWVLFWLLPVAAEDSAPDCVAFALPALRPAEAGFSLATPAAGVPPVPPVDADVVPVGVGVALTDGDGDDDVVELGLADPVGLGDWTGGAVDACPELLGAGLGLHVRELLGERDAEPDGDSEA